MIDLDKPRYFNALAELVGGSENLTGGSTDGPMSKIGFIDGISKPTESAVQIKLASMISDWEGQEYARNREAEYPSVQECVHAILDDELTALQEKRQAVKTKYPKS